MSEKIKKKKKDRVVPDFSILTDEIFEQIKNELEREKNSPKSYIQEAMEKISEKLIELNSMGYTPGQISKVMERVAGINLTAASIKTHLKRKNVEPAKFQKMPQKEKSQKVEEQKIDRDTKKENPKIENEAQKIEVEKTNVDEIVEAKTDEAIEDVKEVKKDDPVIADDEIKKLEEEIKSIENDNTLSAVKKHEKIETLKDSSIAALKNRTKYPNGMSKEEYEKSVTIDPEIAAEGRAKKKIIGG